MPVVHAWYKSSPSGGIHQLLNLSSNEIDKVLAFVKYVLVEEIDAKSLETIKTKVQEQYTAKLAEVEKAYKDELESAGDKKKAKDEIEKLFADNKATLEKEFNRIKSIVADLSFGATIIESDYRNFFRQFAELAPFSSGPDAILKMLRRIDVQKEIQKRVKEFPTIKSEEKRKKAFQLIKLLINLYVSGVRPENMIIKKLPVIPPDLRPVVQLE